MVNLSVGALRRSGHWFMPLGRNWKGVAAFCETLGLLDELSGWVWCFWVVGLLLNPVGRAFPVDVTGGGQGRAL